uniref:V-type proton ATPase subunit a n=1 Tax=Ditylenchus dipsaci TaxID=166011 RepID=A0A915DXA4_9BILA
MKKNTLHLKRSSRMRKICEGFHANVVENCTENAVARSELLRSVVIRLEDMNTVVGKTLEHHQRVLNAAALNIKKWDIQVLKLKSIFHTLNMFNLDITQKCLIAECWVPSAHIIRVRAALQHATELTGSNVASIVNKLETDECPPTYHNLNKFTKAFQGIVDSYGIANYREINPTPWTIITFPFIFAVMFGDTGHGLIMLLAAAALIAFEKKIETAKIKDEIFNTFYGGRYVILLMGAFAVYTGFIYNDFFSKSLNLFGSEWRNPYPMKTLMPMLEQEEKTNGVLALELDPLYSFRPYPFGVDPVWNLALNRLNFLNPMKMKSSIIIGISQMFFGLVLSLLNHLHAGSYVDVFFVFIPQILFLTLIFVYLCIQVILKWVFFWVQPGYILYVYVQKQEQGMAHQDDKKHWEENDQCYLQLWYPNQDKVEAAFILIAVACIPVMLFVKPAIMWFRARNGQQVSSGHGGGHGGDGEFNFGDVMVYQAIHTIEFALGCISHTASYLRLWALSLAHAQLSDVLWTMVLNKGFAQPGVIGMVANFVIFAFFGTMSVAVLVLMEGLSAFLHALRLHWVEFQSKFYIGTGIQFEPFSFHQIIRIHEGMDA